MSRKPIEPADAAGTPPLAPQVMPSPAPQPQETRAQETRAQDAEPALPFSRLRSFMVRLASDPDVLGSMMRDPQAAMTQAGLDAEEQDLLTAGDQGRLYSALKGLPLPAPAAAQPPAQLPTVVAALQNQVTPTPAPQLAAAGAGWPAGGQPISYAAGYQPPAGYPPYQNGAVQSPAYYAYGAGQPQGQVLSYYVVPWPIWQGY